MGQRQSCLVEAQSMCAATEFIGATEITLPAMVQAEAKSKLPTLLTSSAWSKVVAKEAAGKQHVVDVVAKPIPAKDSGEEAQVRAARVIQAAYRGLAVRCQLKKAVEVKVMEEAAVTIQSAYRAYSVRQLMAKVKTRCIQKQRKADRKAAKEAVQPFLTKHGFEGVNAKRLRFWRKSYPLHVAVKEKDHEAIKLLLQAKADPKQLDSSDRTPLALAKRLDRAGSHVDVLKAFKPVLTRCSSQVLLPPTEA